jgi:hypothetical protein
MYDLQVGTFTMQFSKGWLRDAESILHADRRQVQRRQRHAGEVPLLINTAEHRSVEKE